jgi:hypothetical protein
LSLVRAATDLEEGRHAFLVQIDCTSREGGKPLCKPVRILLTADVDALKADVDPIDFRLRGEPDGSGSLYLGSFYEATGEATRKFRIRNTSRSIPLQVLRQLDPNQARVHAISQRTSRPLAAMPSSQVYLHLETQDASCRLDVSPSMKTVRLEPPSALSTSLGKDSKEFEIRLNTDTNQASHICGKLKVFLQGQEGSKLEIQVRSLTLDPGP